MADAISQNFMHQRERYSWVRLFDGLRDWVRVRGIDQITDDALKAMDKDSALEWVTGPQAEGPQGLVLQTFQEDALLWMRAAPTDVVALPRHMFKMIVDALPPSVGPGSFHPMTVDEYAGVGLEAICAAADQRRYMRERAEREHVPSKTDGASE